MKSRFITDPQDSSDGFLYTAGAEIYAGLFHPSLSHPTQQSGNPPASTPVEIPSTPALTSEAVQSLSAQSGATSALAMTSGGITINLLFDAAAMAAPSSFRAGIQQAASLLTAAISDQITVNIKIDYSGTGGGAAAGPDNGLLESYSSVRADLINNVTAGDMTFNALPAGSSFQGQSSVAVWNAQLKLWGLLGANDTTTDDGSATFATDINSSLLVGVALHELTHAMGRVPYGPPYGSSPDIFDFYRFTSVGTRLIDGGNTAPAAYFSVDGGSTKLADYGQTSDPSDLLNSGVQGYNDPFNEFYSGGTLQSLTTVDKQQLDALGFHTLMPVTTTVIEALGSTSLVEVGSNYYLDSISSGTGPELKYGAPVVTGEFTTAGGGTWTPIGAEQTAGGYEVAWKVAGVDQYTVWNVDSSGNYISNSILPISGASAAIENVETSFHQDLNGDGVIGLPSGTVIESFGSTSLLQVGSDYFLVSISTGAGPELKYGGAPVVTGEFTAAGGGTWALIGAEQTADGYEVAWKVAGVDQYTVWNVDSSGNYMSNAISATSGTNPALENVETSFHQDLNGDGVIGIPSATATVIESFGSTSLVQTGSNYFLDSISTGTGPELKYGGSPVVTAEFTAAGGGTWTLIGAEQTAGGYEVAWKVAGVDQYTVWNVDSSGNYLSNSIAATSGTNLAIENVETSFHQDLNGDGVIGIPSATATVIESFGSTSLVQTGSNYFLDSISTGSGPELKYGGSPVVTAEFTAAGGGTWTLIGAEQTASGYEVAWKVAGVDQYTAWNVDSSGNYLSNSIAATSGTNLAIEIAETSFHQDLNGDGTIGIPSATIIESFGSTSLVQTGNNYFLDSNSNGAGTELKYNGSPVTTGEFTAAGGGTWALIGAEQTASGYEVAWKVAGVDQYTVWNVDSSGNYFSNAIAATSGTNLAIENIETSFHQDLNGDGVIGAPATTPVSQGAAVTVASPDSFMFGAGLGRGAATGAGNADLFAHGGFFSAASGDATPFQPANGGQQTVVAPDYHDSAALMHFAFVDSHDGFFIK